MKIAILNDTHCGIRNSSDIFMDYQERFYRDVFFPYLIENDIKQILHLGDYYDNRKTINFKALSHNRKIFLRSYVSMVSRWISSPATMTRTSRIQTNEFSQRTSGSLYE